MIPLGELLWIAIVAIGLGLLVLGLGVMLLRWLRGYSIAVMLAVVAVVTVAATVAGIVWITIEMIVEEHYRDVALTVVAIGGLVGLAVALLLGRRVVADSRRLLAALHDVPARGSYRPPEVRLPRELAAISTELADVHERLREASDRERALEFSRRELVAWVSHDLRTPLAGLRAMAEALEDEVASSPEDISRYHRQIRLEVGRLSGMVDDLFELARIHSGALRLTRRRIGLPDLVADTMAGVEPLAREKGVRLEGSSPEAVPVDVDPAELGRALRNLAVNAIRYTPSDGAVSMDVSTEDGMALVAVSDGCGGIPDEDLPRVFEVAFRGTAARTPSPDGGAGLGLAIARGIVEAHSGAIGVTNSGPGCLFVIRLPLAG